MGGDEEADGVGGDLGHVRVDADLGLPALLALNLDSQQQQLQLDETQPAQKNGLYDTEAYLPHSSHEIWTKNWAKIVQKSVIFECACKLQESQGTKTPDDDL